jgi:CrcB protein
MTPAGSCFHGGSYDVIRLLVVGTGGFVGAIARYVLSGLAHRAVSTSFPVGTLLVNVLGCLCIGVLMTLVQDRQFFSPNVRLLVMTGFLGSLTTFSTMSYETVELFRDGDWRLAFGNIAANLVLGLGVVLAGRAAVRLLNA